MVVSEKEKKFYEEHIGKKLCDPILCAFGEDGKHYEVLVNLCFFEDLQEKKNFFFGISVLGIQDKHNPERKKAFADPANLYVPVDLRDEDRQAWINEHIYDEEFINKAANEFIEKVIIAPEFKEQIRDFEKNKNNFLN